MANYISKHQRKKQTDGKGKITPKTIYRDLVVMEKVNLIGWLVAAAVFLLLSGMFVFVLTIDGLADERWNNILKIVLVAAPFIMAASTTLYYGVRIKNISKRNYKVIRDTVERVVTDDRTVTKYRRGRRVITTEHAMYLYHCGRIVISLQQTYTNSEGDIIYAVVEAEKPTEAVLMYSAKCNDLEGVEVE